MFSYSHDSVFVAVHLLALSLSINDRRIIFIHQALDNVLMIGMTNRMDMIDEALLRPGRLEVHMEISLANEAGRVEILNIHTKSMK